MKEHELKLFEALLRLNQKNLKAVVTNFLKHYYDEVIEHDKFVCAKGTIPIALAAHLDTVFYTTPKKIYYDRSKKVMWSPHGLGADDRAGIFAIIKIIKSGLLPHIIFTTDEEKGALGAEELVKFGNPFENNLKYIIQLDRHGIDDCVFYQCNNLDFIEYVEKFNFREAFGSFTDISIICPAWEIAGVNLSIGYSNEHTYTEYLDIDVMFNTKYDHSLNYKDGNKSNIKDTNIKEENVNDKEKVDNKEDSKMEEGSKVEKGNEKENDKYISPFPVPGYLNDDNLWDFVCDLNEKDQFEIKQEEEEKEKQLQKEKEKEAAFTGIKHLINKRKNKKKK